ncbi:Ribulose bisphosphate carboxylase/oxygenase activase 1 isoform 1 [Hibiscus syriacus]|uniref:non-specific serine/threonine protein kinase n=1 Tax=Hibiscus syriacus TaxID=106335 RepID=A0A6A2Z6C7_HIBSY|nr:Ribulose bisphosphate carboxylase/oxygenase activase 1 isoform 1 [Hibiscus syriacus]
MVVNRLTGTLPPDMFTNLTSLTTLFLGGNLLSGRIPPSIGNASSLTHVDLANNSFHGQIPWLGNLPNIQILSLQYNQLVNDGPSGMDFLTSLANSTQLQVFSVAGNWLTGRLPSSIGNLSRQLSLLVMNNNFFEGNLAEEISNLVNVTLIAFEHNSLTGTIPPSIGTLPNLQYIYLHGNRFSGTIPYLGNCQRLQLLYLSLNLLNGTIPSDIFGISSFSMVLNLSFNSLTGFVRSEIGNPNVIQAIDFSSNELSGDIPFTIGDCIEYIDLSSKELAGNIPASLESLRLLQVLNLSRNQLSGEVPRAGIFRNSTSVFLSENLKLCGGVPDLGLPRCDSPGKKSSGSRLRIVLIASFASAAFIIASVTRKKDPGLRQVKEEADSPENQFGIFDWRGQFWISLQGVFNDGSLAAIKVFKMGIHGASKSFLAESEVLRSIRHLNLVKIISICSAGDFKALVLKFMPNGNLEQVLHPRSEDSEVVKALDMNQRLKIAQDVASALEYLHHDRETLVVHRDLKPSNVLLDEEMSAHVTDFGLARILLKNSPNAHLSSSLGLKGSIGYMAPEYGMGAGVLTRGDVYSFGIVILEMFTRKRPIDNMFSGDMDLQKWILMHLPGNFHDIVDRELMQKERQLAPAYDDGIGGMLKIGLMCARKSPDERPTMREVSVMIKNVKASLSE